MSFPGSAVEADRDSPQNQSSIDAGARISGPPAVALALLAGLLGFAINQAPIDMGAGLHMLLGGIPAFVLVRLISPGLLAIPVAIAAAETFFLWGHAWAALIWVIEGVAVATIVNRTKLPLVVADGIFWMVLGGPMVWIAYTQFLDTDSLSALLTILKQAINAILVAVLGEAGHFLLLRFDVFRFKPRLRIRFESVVINLMAIFTIISAITFIAWDGVRRQAQASMLIDRQLATLAESIKHSANVYGAFETAIYVAAAKSNPLELASFWKALNSTNFQSLADAISLTAANGSLLALWERTPGAATGPNAPVTEIAGLEGGISIKVTLSVTNLLAVLMPNERSAGTEINLIDPEGNRFPPAAVAPYNERKSTTLMNDKRSEMAARLVDLPFPRGWRAEIAIPVAPLVMETRSDQVLSLAIVAALATLAIGASLPVARMVGRVVRWAGHEAESISSARPLGDLSPALMSVYEVAMLCESLQALEKAVAAERHSVRLYRERLELLVSSAPTIIYSLAINDGKFGKPTMVSRSIESFMGYSMAESMSDEWWPSNIHPEDRAGAEASIIPSLQTGFGVQQYRFRDKQGKWHWIRDSISVLYDDNRVPVEAVGMWVDVTDDHTAQERLLHTTKLATLGEMATGLAHELNQPLNTIALASANAREYLTRPQADLENLARKLNRIDQQVSRARVIIEHMRIFGRADSGSRRPTAVVNMIDTVLSLIGASLRNAGIEVVREIAPNLPFIPMNAVLIEQLVINLLTNSRDAIQSQGGPGTIILRAGVNDGKFFLEVEDDGGGIPVSIMSRVMEPFFTTKEPGKGTGLGLSIAYGIAQEHGGELSVKNIRKGALFRLEFGLESDERSPVMTDAGSFADIAS